MWDVFISHASEDRATVVGPLVRALELAGVKVWVDTEELTLGDSLRLHIDEGLAGSRFGVMVLSPAFFRKAWAQRELAAALALEIHHGKRILPVLHEMDFRTLSSTAPLLADKVGVSTSNGLDVVVREILRAIGRPVTRDVPRDVFGDPQSLVGRTIGGYSLERHVGSGGSGMVFQGSHPSHRDSLAVKVFYPLRPGFQHLVGMFHRGFRAVQAVRHPGVVAAIDSGSVDLDGRRTTFLVTELVSGSPLDQWQPAGATDDARYLERLRVSCELASALAACHAAVFVDELGFQARGVLHGDLKPANVLVDDAGHPRLIDFLQVDVQRLIDPRAGDPQLLQPITGAVGTPGFMAPEQERHGVVTASTDIYSFGLTLGVFLGGGGSPLGIMHKDNVGSAMKQLFMTMIAHDASQRPAGMAQVEQSLTTIFEAEKARLA